MAREPIGYLLKKPFPHKGHIFVEVEDFEAIEYRYRKLYSPVYLADEEPAAEWGKDVGSSG